MSVPDEQERPYLTREYLENHGWSLEHAPDRDVLLETTAAFFRELLDAAGDLLGPEGRALELGMTIKVTPTELDPDVDQLAAAAPCGTWEVHLPALTGLVSRCICIRVEK